MIVNGDTADAVARSDGTRILTGTSGRVGAGGGFSPGGRDAIYVFRLPESGLGSARPVLRASVQFAVVSDQKDGEYNIDLYGLGARTASTVLSSDYFAGPLDLSDATLLQKGIIPGAHPDRGVESVATSAVADTALTNYLNDQYVAGHAGHYVFLRLNPDVIPISEETGVDVAFAESASNKPQLTLEFVPEPEMVWVWPLAAWALGLRRHCRSNVKRARVVRQTI
jgi:hypothetical protein